MIDVPIPTVQASVADQLIGPGSVAGAISVGTTPVEAKVGVSRLASRAGILIVNNGTDTIYWGFSSTVSPSTGIPLPPGAGVSLSFSADQAVAIYLVAAAGTHNVRIAEFQRPL